MECVITAIMRSLIDLIISGIKSIFFVPLIFLNICIKENISLRLYYFNSDKQLRYMEKIYQLYKRKS